MLSINMKVLAVSGLLLTASFAEAAPRTLNELLNYVESISPDLIKARSQFEVTQAGRISAAQIPNPEVALGNWRGKAASQSWKQTDITVTQPLEIGGKRGSRIDVADAAIRQAAAQVQALTAEIRMRALFALYRVRQLKDEIVLLEEARDTFTHLVGNYRKRPQLSPEQQTSLFSFELAKNDCALKLAESRSEFLTLEGDVKLLTGFTVAELLPILPPRKKAWPASPAIRELNSPNLRILSAQAELSEKELQLAKADVWPTVNVGPSYTMQDQFGGQANILGVVVSFPIPVLNQNNGARAQATKAIANSRKLISVEKAVLEIRRENLIQTYVSSSQVLGEQADRIEINLRHGQVEKNFLNGLISSPLVLESHRLMFDNQRLYHDRELKTLDVYYQLVLMQGGTVEELM